MSERAVIKTALLDAPVLFGLTAQGHIPKIERMLGEGASWPEIGQMIGWCPRTAERHYSLYLESRRASMVKDMQTMTEHQDDPITVSQDDIKAWHDAFNDEPVNRAAHDYKAIKISMGKAREIAADIAAAQLETDPDAETIDSGIILEVLADHEVHPAFENKIPGVWKLFEELKGQGMAPLP